MQLVKAVHVAQVEMLYQCQGFQFTLQIMKILTLTADYETLDSGYQFKDIYQQIFLTKFNENPALTKGVSSLFESAASCPKIESPLPLPR